MPPRKKPQQSKAKLLKQTTLLDAKLPVIQSPAKSSQARPSPAKRRKRNSHASQMPHSESDNDSDSSHMKAIKFAPPSPIEISDNEEDEESIPAPFISKKRKAIILDSDSDVESKGDSNCLPRRKHLMKRGIATKKVQQSEDESSEEEETNTCGHHLVKGKRPAKALSSEDEDMAEEVEQERILKTRLRTRGKKSVYQKNLDKLKRRKEGKPEESPSSSSDEESSGSEVEPFKGARPSSDHDSLFDEDSDAPSDFIVEDDGTEVAQLPTQFSMESHQDLSHQFKKIFQFFVRVAVHPGDERHAYMAEQMRCEEYFSVPLQVTRRKISGLRDSLVASSVWRPEYKLALQKHPEFELAPLDFAIPFCDACHLGGRMSTLVGRVSGSPYDSIGFEDQKDSSDSESDSDDKEEIKTEFHLGRFCARRTRVYHEFLHWEYALFKSILREVDEIRSHKGTKKGFTRVAYAGGKQPPEDLTDADGICDWLDERSIIESEWQKIKGMMESARNLEMVAKRGDPDAVL